MKKLVLWILLLVTFSALASAESCLFYFYGENCNTCAEVDNYISQLEMKDDLTIEKYEVYFNQENSALLHQYFTAYGIKKESQGLPVVFTGGSYFIGRNAIMNLLDEHLKTNNISTCPSLVKSGSVGLVGESSPPNVLETLTFGIVTSASFNDSIGVGMLTLFMFLLLFIILIKDQEKILINGFIFISAIATIYLIYAFGWLDWFPGHSRYFSKIVGIGSILFALGYFKSFFGSWKVFLQKIPQNSLEQAQKMVAKIISPKGVLLTALIITVWTFSRVDTVLVILRTLFTDQITRWAVFPLILYYLLIMLIPMILILLGVYFFKKEAETYFATKFKDEKHRREKWQEHGTHVFNAIISALMLVIGTVLVFV